MTLDPHYALDLVLGALTLAVLTRPATWRALRRNGDD